MRHSGSATISDGMNGRPKPTGFAGLKPYDPIDAIGIRAACKLSGWSRPRVIELCEQNGLGRKIGARWAISKVALHAFLNDDREGLSAYLGGDRAGPAVTCAYHAAGVPLPSQRG
jgi:hypothetical protein